MCAEVWLRPWAAFEPRWRKRIEDGRIEIPENQAAPVYLWSARNGITRRVRDVSEAVAEFRVLHDGPQGGEVETELRLLALPLDGRGVACDPAGEELRIVWPSLPKRPRGGSFEGAEEEAGHRLMLRAQAVWDRIRDVDDALEDPARLWPDLYERWFEAARREPRMDVIVRHAEALAGIIDALEHRARRVLRRVHRMIPVGRIQEVDRRSMLWIARQPGMTLAEKAGLEQRLLAVAREENFDTLENRVVRAYCELARRHAADYLDRNRTRRETRRARIVEGHGRRCGRLARALADAGVRRTGPDVTPNYVLMDNPEYRAVWEAWRELLLLERVRDELWRWQPRSWEEFCTLALMVAVAGLKGGQLVAASPIWFRDEQRRGFWIEADSPLGVVYLPEAGVIVELTRGRPPRPELGRLGASVWIRVGRVGDIGGFLRRIAVWPLWSPDEMNSDALGAEAQEIARVIGHGAVGEVTGGILLRPGGATNTRVCSICERSIAIAIGTEGEALAGGLRALSDYLSNVLSMEAG